MSRVAPSPVSISMEELHHQAAEILRIVAQIAPYGSENLALSVKQLSLFGNLQTSSRWCNNTLEYSAYCYNWLYTLQESDVNFKIELSEHLKPHRLKLLLMGCGLDRSSSSRLIHQLSQYLWVKQFQAGRCDALAASVFIEALIRIEEDWKDTPIHLFSGTNFTHAFIVIGEIAPDALEDLKKNSIVSVSKLGDNCLVVDPWIRCSFKAKHCKHYWMIMQEANFIKQCKKSGPIDVDNSDSFYCQRKLTVSPFDSVKFDKVKRYVKASVSTYCYPLNSSAVDIINLFAINVKAAKHIIESNNSDSLIQFVSALNDDQFVSLINRMIPLAKASKALKACMKHMLLKAYHAACMNNTIARCNSDGIRHRLPELQKIRDAYRNKLGLMPNEFARNELARLRKNFNDSLHHSGQCSPTLLAQPGRTLQSIHQQYRARIHHIDGLIKCDEADLSIEGALR